jgi:hypothetical protein
VWQWASCVTVGKGCDSGQALYRWYRWGAIYCWRGVWQWASRAAGGQAVGVWARLGIRPGVGAGVPVAHRTYGPPQPPQCRNQHLEMQQLPIGRPDPAPKRPIIQRKSHGKADARGLTGPEIAERQAIAREKAEKEAGEQVLGGESQSAITITLALRSPQAPAPAPSPSFLPALTVPPRLNLQRKDSPEQEQVEEDAEEQQQGRWVCSGANQPPLIHRPCCSPSAQAPSLSSSGEPIMPVSDQLSCCVFFVNFRR